MFNEYIENFISLDECTELINFGLSCNLIDMQSTSFDNNGNPLKNHNSNFLKRKGYYFTSKEKDHKIIKNLSSKIIEISNKLSPFKSTLYTTCDKYTFNKYDSGDFLKWHSDMQEIKNAGTITIILQLLKLSLLSTKFSLQQMGFQGKSRSPFFLKIKVL